MTQLPHRNPFPNSYLRLKLVLFGVPDRSTKQHGGVGGNGCGLGSNPVAPTILQKKPFGENVEGLSHFRDESYGFMIVF